MNSVNNNTSMTTHVEPDRKVDDDSPSILGMFASLAAAKQHVQVDPARVSQVNVTVQPEADKTASIPVILVTPPAEPPASKPPEVNAKASNQLQVPSILKNEEPKAKKEKSHVHFEENPANETVQPASKPLEVTAAAVTKVPSILKNKEPKAKQVEEKKAPATEKPKVKKESAKQAPATEKPIVKTEKQANVASYASSLSYNGGDYKGPLLDGMPHGHGGRLIYPDGSRYEGDFVKGLREGTGYLRQNKAVYQGEFKADKREGKGHLSFNGGYFDGDWKNGKRNGQGTLFFNLPSLLGGYEWKEGSYAGQFNDDKIDGELKYTTYDGKFEQTLIMENGAFKSETELKPVKQDAPVLPSPEKKQKLADEDEK